MADGDRTQALCEAVRQAFEQRQPLRIAGTGSKAHLARPTADAHFEATATAAARLLSVTEHRGVVDYRPEELVITVRAGTPLRDVERELDRQRQMLPFEPPRLRGGGSIGGAVASGLAGPGRPWRGAVRDALLGVELVNGRGEHLRFGGQVMKNVAGYDVSRLQAGAFGTFGVLLSVSVKLLPAPEAEQSRAFELPAAEALHRCREWARQPLPITGTCWVAGRLRVRLSGATAAVASAAAAVGGEAEADCGFWHSLRDHRLEHFSGPGLWRCSLPPAAPEPLDDCLVSWAGAERWWRPGNEPSASTLLAAQGGHGRPFGAGFGVRTGPATPPAEHALITRLKAAFDPVGILNPELSARSRGAHHAN